MVEDAVLEEAVAGVLAKDESIDLPEILIAGDLKVVEWTRKLREALLRRLKPLLRIRVRAEEARQRALLRAGLEALERGEHVRHGPRVVVVLEHVLEAEVVGLALGVTSILEEEQLKSRARDVAIARDGG